MGRRLWTREEFMLVMNLYTKIRYGQFNNKNSEVIKLAELINKTPGAVAYKLVHLSSQDPYHQNRGIKGLANPGKNAIEIYRDFKENWDEMLYQSEVLLAKYKNKTIEQEYSEWEDADLEVLKNKKVPHTVGQTHYEVHHLLKSTILEYSVLCFFLFPHY